MAVQQQTSLRGRYAIAGIGETELGKLPGRSTLSLHLEAMKSALADAGLTNQDVDGLLTNQPMHDPMRCYAAQVAHAAGITPTYATDLAMGGATPVAMAQHAAMAISAGLCKTVMCVHARNQASKHLLPHRADEVRNGTEDFKQPYGLLGAIAEHAFLASRHMYEFGTTSEQLGAVAVAFRKHACANASATMHKPITIEDHQNSRWIVEPLRLLDCALVSDGGGAFIVTSAERARDLAQRPAYILGMGSHVPMSNHAEAETLTTLGGKRSSQMAYDMAGLSPKDMDFAEIYDCFTITVVITLEDYGFCPKGEGGRGVQDGRIEMGGELPVNTHGGLLSQAHIEGMLHVTEAVKQLRGGVVEPERQVPGARVGIVSGHGADGNTHASLILSNEVAA
ncbi:MAG: thiolase family protein [Chloroflexota bacterium]